MSEMPLIDTHPRGVMEEADEAELEHKPTCTSSLTEHERMKPRHRRNYTEYTTNDERDITPVRSGLIQEMYKRSKQQYKRCVNDVEQLSSDANPGK